MPEITAVFISTDRTRLMIELDDGDTDLLHFQANMEPEDSVESVATMGEDTEWIALGGGRSLGHGGSNRPTT
jgi:hypothetical protein